MLWIIILAIILVKRIKKKITKKKNIPVKEGIPCWLLQLKRCLLTGFISGAVLQELKWKCFFLYLPCFICFTGIREWKGLNTGGGVLFIWTISRILAIFR